MKQDGLFGCWIQYIRILVSDSIEKSPRAAFLRPSNRILNLFLKCTSKKKKKQAGEEVAKTMTMCGKQLLERLSREYRGDAFVAQQFV